MNKKDKKKLKNYKFDTSKYVILDDGLRRIDTKELTKSLKEDTDIYIKELKEAVKKQDWLGVLHTAIELQAIEDAKFYLFKKEY